MIKSNIKKEFNCDIEKIWNIITDNYNYAWRSDISKIEVIDDKHFIEYTKIKGKWTGLLKVLSDEKVELDFTEEIETNNILRKLLAKSYLKSNQKRYFKDLENEIKR